MKDIIFLIYMKSSIILKMFCLPLPKKKKKKKTTRKLTEFIDSHSTKIARVL